MSAARRKKPQTARVIERLSKEVEALQRELYFWLPSSVWANSNTAMSERVRNAGRLCGEDPPDSEPDAEKLGWIAPASRRLQAKTTVRKKQGLMGQQMTGDGDRVVIFAQDGWGYWMGAYDDGQTGLWDAAGKARHGSDGEDLIL